MTLDLTKPMRSLRPNHTCEYRYIGVMPSGESVFAWRGSNSEAWGTTVVTGDLAAQFVNVPEVKESWSRVYIDVGDLLPYASPNQHASLSQARESSHGVIGILHLRYDGTTLTADVLPAN